MDLYPHTFIPLLVFLTADSFLSAPSVVSVEFGGSGICLLAMMLPSVFDYIVLASILPAVDA